MFYENIENYCKKNNLTIMGFEQKCGLANATVAKWKNGSSPNLQTLEKISVATNIPIAKWLK